MEQRKARVWRKTPLVTGDEQPQEFVDISTIPIMQMGKYRGMRIDQLPNSYLRWMLGQDFPSSWKDIALKKLGANATDRTLVDVTRHAMDSFSLRFMDRWDGETGIGSFIAQLAMKAYQDGKDVSKKRHSGDGKIMEYDGIKFVFSQQTDPIITLITVM